jgi:orotate phosphoribosyltransferase
MNLTLDNLQQLLVERSARRGHFTLSSGRESTLYIDARLTTMSPEGLVIIGHLGLSALRQSGWNVQSIGGLTLGADPVAYAIAYTSLATGQLIRAFSVRKETKSHGTGRLIEGPFAAGDRVAIVEDVITTGGSALKAIAAVQAAGGFVVGVLSVVDRQEGGREAIEMMGVPMIALTTGEQIVTRMA